MARNDRAQQQRAALGRRIALERMLRDLTQMDVARHIGSGKAQLWAIETAGQDVLSGTLIAVVEALGLRLEVVAEHHVPLLDLTADEIAVLRTVLRDLRAGAGWVTPKLASAIDKLTTTEETPDVA